MTRQTDRPIISVVVGVLNGGKYLEHMLDSFSRQSLARKEIVILDGGSSDNTVEILERRSSEIAFWRSEPDRGLYDAWNNSLAHCRGEYVGFVGCDDQFADDRVLERLADRAVAAEFPDLVCSLNVLVDDDGRFIKVIGAPWDWHGMKRSMNLAHSCLLHRRQLFERHGAFEPDYRIGADYDFLLRLGPTARAAFVEQISVRVGANGMSHRLWTTTYREHWHLQARNPHVGLRLATKNLAGNVMRYAYRKIRGRR
jgi:glycosyltransferase involved in cell wall biosynthesis